MYLKIGFIQCLAMVPGVSRSGSTIVGAMLLGADKRAAAEFSFFLAMPTMAGAFTYDLMKNYKELTTNDLTLITIGFVTAFISALIVVRSFLDFVSKRGSTPFASWRIIVGPAGLAGLGVPSNISRNRSAAGASLTPRRLTTPIVRETSGSRIGRVTMI
eukprot:gene13767-17446_t